MRYLVEKRLQVKTLGTWSVTDGGRPALKGRNLKIILHALILGDGAVFREDLAALIGERDTHTPSGKYVGVKNALSKLRRRYSLRIPEDEDPVILSKTQPDAFIDLWEFFAHVRCGRFKDAHALIANGEEPYLFAGTDDPDHHIWKKTLEEFRAARDRVTGAIEATSGSRRTMLATRERLLGRSLVPGVGPTVPIREARSKLEDLNVPWSQERPEATRADSPLPQHLAETLGPEGPIPTQAILVGPPGAGKTLTAISTFLRLTDPLASDPTAPSARTILYIDPEAEGSQPGFGTSKWLERRLHEQEAEGRGRPVVIMPHGDALLSPRANLKSLLNSRLFRDHDLLLCCGTQLYSRRLSYEDIGTHVVHLEPWSLGLQKAFARRIAGGRKYREFQAWVKEEPTREQLCDVPLHLVHVLSLLGDGAEALAEISTPAQLFDGVARMRLRVGRTGFDEDELMRDLGALAHRFYADAAPADTPISFTTEELTAFIRRRKRKDARHRSEAMINNTLLAVGGPGSTLLRFEEPSWGWYFVAWHLAHTLLYHPDRASASFSKLLSAWMMELCEEMLTEKLRLYEDEIYTSLDTALREGPKDVNSARSTIARTQIGYLLAVVGDEQIRRDLTAMVEPGSPAMEPNILVRRGITLGLADAGVADVADMYVEALTAEREAGGACAERDANIGFLLSSRGDRRLDITNLDRTPRNASPIRTVGELVESLDDPKHSGSWRIKLFTLIDLERHPLVSKRRYVQALNQHRKPLRERLDGLRRHPPASNWPELEELSHLLESESLES